MNRLLTFLLLLSSLFPIAADSIYIPDNGDYHPFDSNIVRNNTTDTLSYSIPLNDSSACLTANLRIINLRGNPDFAFKITSSDGKTVKVTNPEWGIRLNGDNCNLDITFTPFAKGNILGIDKSGIKVDIASNNRTIASAQWTDNISTDKENMYLLQRNGDEWTLKCGNSIDPNCISFSTANSGSIHNLETILYPAAALDIRYIGITSVDPFPVPPAVGMDWIRERLNTSHDNITGIWEVYDYDINPDYISDRPSLRLALIPDNDGTLSLYYLDGYGKEEPLWERGMLKAFLTPSPFDGIYNMEWYNADFRKMDKYLTADLSNPQVIKLIFTKQQSSIRLLKIKKDSYPGYL